MAPPKPSRRRANPTRRVHRYQDPDVAIEVDATVFTPAHHHLCPNPVCVGTLQIRQARWAARWVAAVHYQCDTCERHYMWHSTLRPVDERGLMGPRIRLGARYLLDRAGKRPR
jgi:hypothetical protein